MTTITFAATEEHGLLRETAAKLLADQSPSARVRELMATPAGFAEAEWDQTVAMGWAALPIPELLGGAGYGWTEMSVLAEEMGRVLWCAPWLSSAVLATAALLDVRGEVADALLAELAAGSTRATLTTRATGLITDGTTVSGTAAFVLDGATADVLLLEAQGPHGPMLVQVAQGADGLVSTALPVLDLTRKQVDLQLDAVACVVVAEGATVTAALARAVLVGAAMLANEQVGGTARVLAESVSYGRSRLQFGRAIGSYQALKHRMADTLKELEAARSAAYHAARAVDGDDAQEALIATAMAASYCGEVYERAAGNNIQNHGGIGFTWEHDAHLYFKRAKSSKLLLGGATSWRARLGDALGL
ncbi:MAG: alkylation response protein AidB-like acyl-CoA dehydrogenase [Nitriliruptoraceae bacterium]|jgi:alkylation response protein AidB-like acyl-CoA dehydrogenase